MPSGCWFTFFLPSWAWAVARHSPKTKNQPSGLRSLAWNMGMLAGFLKQFPKQHEVQLVGIVDADTELSHRYAQQFHLDPSLFYTQLDAMIAARHPQALLVYTSVGKHRQVIEAAAQHGLSVMVEKPLTMSLEDALAIRRAAREHHIQVLVNYETTWYASNRAAYDEVAKGVARAICAESWCTMAMKDPRRSACRRNF